MKTVKKQDILMTGVGGQGTILASDILGEAALLAGYDIKKTDTLGMAQRGGSVISHIRIGDHVYAPLIAEGDVDILIAFEKLEAIRWCTYLRTGGIAIINNLAMPPLSVGLGTSKYPDDKEILAVFKKITNHVYFVDGTSRAQQLGDARTLNTLMMGCISTFLPIDIPIWKEAIAHRIPAKIREINFRAFDEGREALAHVNIG